jgi:hypothetical protein
MDDALPESVRDNKLETRFPRKYEVIHLIDDPGLPPSAPPRQEHWRSGKRPIGGGGQGQVYLQTCIAGGRHHTHRALKMIHLQDGGGRRRYTRELEAITRFSHARVSCEVPSRWLENYGRKSITREKTCLLTYIRSILNTLCSLWAGMKLKAGYALPWNTCQMGTCMIICETTACLRTIAAM